MLNLAFMISILLKNGISFSPLQLCPLTQNVSAGSDQAPTQAASNIHTHTVKFSPFLYLLGSTGFHFCIPLSPCTLAISCSLSCCGTYSISKVLSSKVPTYKSVYINQTHLFFQFLLHVHLHTHTMDHLSVLYSPSLSASSLPSPPVLISTAHSEFSTLGHPL